MGFEGRRGKRFEAAEEFAERMRQAQEEVKAALGKAQEKMRKYTDRKRREGEGEEMGQKLVQMETFLGVGGWKTKDFMCNTDLCRNHKFRCQLCTKEFKGR